MIVVNNSRIVITNLEQSGPLDFESTITISTLSIEDGGEYSCEVTIGPQPPSQFITGNTRSATETLTIQGKI